MNSFSESPRKKILILSHDKIGDSMAGPGIRYHNMAKVLSRSFDVTVGFFDPTYLPDDSFSRDYAITHVERGKFKDSFVGKDAIIAMWLGEDMMQFCKDNGVYTVFDAYAPVPVENLALVMLGGDPITTDTDFFYRQSYNLYEKFFQYGDLFLFSNRRQIDFWMGYVFGSSLISVSSYIKRPVFDRFIEAPMGINMAVEVVHTKNVIRGTINGIAEGDKILLWTGGIWNWFDAQTLIKAMKRLEKIRPDIKLVFFGTKHPNPDVPSMKEAADTLALSKKLKLLNKTVFIHDGWVPYDERLNYLIEADVAINTAKDTIESELSHRTRVLDHFLAGLPTIATSGDYLSDEIIARKELGIVVPPLDDRALSEAIIACMEDGANKRFRANVEKERAHHGWDETLKQLHDTLTDDLTKLPFVEFKKPREMPKNKLSYKIAKRLLPRKIKSLVVKVLRYGR